MRFALGIKKFREQVMAYAQSVYIRIQTWSKRIVLPGFQGVPLFDVFVFFFRGLRRSSINTRANSVSFNIILAAIPGILFLFTLIPYIPVDGLHDSILRHLNEMMPDSAYQAVESTIEDIVVNHRTGLLSIGFFLSLFFFTDSTLSIMQAFNQSSHTIETRSPLMRYIIALLLIFILTLIVLSATSIMIFSSFIVHYLETEGLFQSNCAFYLIYMGEWIVLFVMILVAFSVLYYMAPAKRGSFPFFSAGAISATLLSLISAELFSFFINNFSQANKLYGSLGALMVILIYININSHVLLIGYELNASIYSARKVRDRSRWKRIFGE